MRSRVARAMIAAVLGLCASAAFAHHSFAMFDQAKQVTVVGKHGEPVNEIADFQFVSHPLQQVVSQFHLLVI